MATVITAGNATNGLSFTADNTGSFDFKTGTGAGTTALTLTTSQTAMFAGTVQASGITTNLYPLVSGTAVASTSGTSVTFTDIPSWVKRITVMFQGVSTNGSSVILVRLGTSGGVVTSGYNSTVSYAASAGAFYTDTSGFPINTSSNTSASGINNGVLTIVNITGNTWCVSGTNAVNTVTPAIAGSSSSLGAVLDRVRITTVNGTDTFDAGSINILYE